jgi:hypothetical protein
MDPLQGKSVVLLEREDWEKKPKLVACAELLRRDLTDPTLGAFREIERALNESDSQKPHFRYLSVKKHGRAGREGGAAEIARRILECYLDLVLLAIKHHNFASPLAPILEAEDWALPFIEERYRGLTPEEIREVALSVSESLELGTTEELAWQMYLETSGVGSDFKAGIIRSLKKRLRELSKQIATPKMAAVA